MTIIEQFIRDERGSPSIEYGVIGTLLAVMCIAGARSIGLTLSTKWLGPLGSAFN